MNVWVVVGTGWAALALGFAVLWAWCGRRRDVSAVDVAWAYGIGALALWYALAIDAPGARRALVAGCVLLWSLRLGTFLLRHRVLKAEGEDARYAHLRAHWGEGAQRKFFWFFQGQALADVLLCVPVVILLSANARVGLSAFEWAGAAVVVLAVVGERVADEQLRRWKADPANRGRTCRRGLWAWSRHPNYFFEWCHWLAYPVMGVPLLLDGRWGLWLATWLSALVMLALLLRGTGIPHTEKQALRSRGDDYRRYQQEVSAFVPWFPRRGGQAHAR